MSKETPTPEHRAKARPPRSAASPSDPPSAPTPARVLPSDPPPAQPKKDKAAKSGKQGG